MITLVSCNFFFLSSPKAPYMNLLLAFSIFEKKKIYVINLSAQLDCRFFKGKSFDLFLHPNH